MTKDQLYRMRHPDRVKMTYQRHYAENKDRINEKRRAKRRISKAAITREFDQQNTTASQPCDDASRDVACTDVSA